MNTNSCIKNLLKLILLLQNNSSNKCINNCSKPYLGVSNNSNYNTRVISLYKKNGDIYTIEYTDNEGNNLTSSIFRVMGIDGDCCTLLILNNNNNNNYSSTGQYITVNLNCICAVRCLIDTNISNI